MKNALNSLMLLNLILFAFGCSNDKAPIEANELFVIESEILDGFISLSNQNGEILYDTVGADLRRTIKVLVPQGDIVDLTHGHETSKTFSIVTYRDIESGFLLSRELYNCSDEFNQDNGFEYKALELEINGIHQYSELYYPFDHKADVEVNIAGDKLILKGSITGLKDVLLTVLPEGESEYQSFHLKFEDWLDQGENRLFRSINIDDFTASEIHEIDLGVDDIWMVNAEIQTENDQIISLSKWTTYSDYQHGDRIKLFVPGGINLDLLKLEVGNGDVHNGYQYLKKTAEIPNQISFYDPEISFLEASSTDYEITVNGDFGLTMVEYRYEENNWISLWKVYQKQNVEILNTLPLIPNDFMLQSPILSNQLSNPETIVVHVYEMSAEVLEGSYNQTGIDRHLKCMDYSSKYIGKEL